MKIIHIDTSILVSPLLDKGDKKQSAGKTLYNIIKSGDYHIRISQVVIGEAISNIYEKSRNDMIDSNMNKFIDTLFKLKAEIKPLNKNIVESALGLHEIDNRIDFCDCIIIATAMIDNADILLMRSSEYVESEKLRNYIKGRSGVKITDTL